MHFPTFYFLSQHLFDSFFCIFSPFLLLFPLSFSRVSLFAQSPPSSTMGVGRRRRLHTFTSLYMLYLPPPHPPLLPMPIPCPLHFYYLFLLCFFPLLLLPSNLSVATLDPYLFLCTFHTFICSLAFTLSSPSSSPFPCPPCSSYAVSLSSFPLCCPFSQPNSFCSFSLPFFSVHPLFPLSISAFPLFLSLNYASSPFSDLRLPYTVFFLASSSTLPAPSSSPFLSIQFPSSCLAFFALSFPPPHFLQLLLSLFSPFPFPSLFSSALFRRLHTFPSQPPPIIIIDLVA